MTCPAPRWITTALLGLLPLMGLAETPSWLERRDQTFKAIEAANQQDKAGLATLKKRLLEFEKDFTSITPMEAMDLQQVYYLPNTSNLTETLTQIAAIATLGWYDALRFGSASGRAEIIHNEGFFKKAFLAREGQATKALLALLEHRSTEAGQAVEKGVLLAQSVKDKVRYDTRWPLGYGLEGKQCALQSDNAACTLPTGLSPDLWSGAWDDAVSTVRRYYRINR
jgi:hypothetical protein